MPLHGNHVNHGLILESFQGACSEWRVLQEAHAARPRADVTAPSHWRRSSTSFTTGGKEDDAVKDVLSKTDEEENSDEHMVAVAVKMAETAIERAKRSMSYGHHLQLKLKDLKAERLTSSLEQALEKFVEDAQSLGQIFQKMTEDRGQIEKQMHSGNTDASLRALADHTEDANKIAVNMTQSLGEAYRRAWTLVDVHKMASSRPTLEEATDPPLLSEAEENETPLKTSAGCVCKKDSTCAEHGREYKWCEVQKPDASLGQQCPLFWDVSQIDAAGNDHRLAGSGANLKMWDYCRLREPQKPKDGVLSHEPDQDYSQPAFAHRGCKCAFRGDLIAEYSKNPVYLDKSGRFDWSKVPWADRLGLEAMSTWYDQKKQAARGGGSQKVELDSGKVCVRTSSSVPWHICSTDPTAKGTGWCADHSWTFCIPRDPSAAPSTAPKPVEPVESVVKEVKANSRPLLIMFTFSKTADVTVDRRWRQRRGRAFL